METTNCKILVAAIEAIAAERGVKARKDMMLKCVEQMTEDQSWLFQQTLKYAYDASIRFGISAGKIDKRTTSPARPQEFGSWVFTLLDNVIAESSATEKKQLIEEKLATMSRDGADLLLKVIDKDLRCGISESTINKVFNDLLSKFDVMLAKPFAARHVSKWPVLVEPKLDGLRVIAIADTAAKDVRFFTRSGKTIDSLNNFKDEVLTFAYQFETESCPHVTVAFDGEVTSGSFLESLSQVRKSSKQVTEGTYHIFDVLVRGPGHSPIAMTDAELQEQGVQKERRSRLLRSYMEFRKHIPQVKFLKLTECYLASCEDEVFSIYNGCRDAGLEGVIIKNPDAYYVKKRSPAWLKIKAQETLDLPVVGAFEGTGKYVGMLGGLIVESDGVHVHVGSGFSDDQRKTFWEQIQDDQRFVASDKRDSCILIDCPVEVQFQEKLPSGSLRHPVFVRLRRDKAMGMVGAF